MERFDIIIIGAGIAGVAAAFELSKRASVLILEQESQPGYHATGRSAAVYAASYGSENTALYALVQASWEFFENPPAGFAEHPLYCHRGVLFAAEQEHLQDLRLHYEQMKQRNPDAEWVGSDFIKTRFPPLKDNYSKAAIYDPRVYDLDVSALQQGYLKAIRQSGGVIKTNARVSDIQKEDDLWLVRAGAEEYASPCLVNAAGAWVDEVAQMASVGKIGIQPLRRSVVLIDGPVVAVSNNWPMVVEFREEFYFKPDAGKLLVSSANEDSSEPCDAQPDDLDIAYAVHFAERALNLSVTRVNHSWAGLRSFVADRMPVIGFDPQAAGFFWLAGQGGYGIQTAPAAGRLCAALIFSEGVPEDLRSLGLLDSLVSPDRVISGAKGEHSAPNP